MPDSLLKQYQPNAFSDFCSTYWTACSLLHRKRDLEQLVTWATRKNLPRPRQFYRHLLIDIDQRLWHWQRRNPFACHVADIAVSFASLFAAKKQFKKGYATQFRN